jgi:hypothetical protein
VARGTARQTIGAGSFVVIDKTLDEWLSKDEEVDKIEFDIVLRKSVNGPSFEVMKAVVCFAVLSRSFGEALGGRVVLYNNSLKT